jgi:hypothetical protein
MQCVFCEAKEGLNASMTITLDDGEKTEVLLCDVHAEDATIKTAKAAYMQKQQKINELMEAARALGLEISSVKTQGSLLIPQMKQKPQPTSAPAPTPAPVTTAEKSDFLPEEEADLIPTSKLQAVRGMVSVGGQTEYGSVASHNQHDLRGLQNQLPQGALEGRAKMTVVEGREGMPVVVPSKQVDGMGVTKIRVTKKENDNSLQRRFKGMADDSMRDHVPNFARAGYQNTLVSCPFCKGKQTVRHSQNGRVVDIDCPKCNGAGEVSVY